MSDKMREAFEKEFGQPIKVFGFTWDEIKQEYRDHASDIDSLDALHTINSKLAGFKAGFVDVDPLLDALVIANELILKACGYDEDCPYECSDDEDCESCLFVRTKEAIKEALVPYEKVECDGCGGEGETDGGDHDEGLRGNTEPCEDCHDGHRWIKS